MASANIPQQQQRLLSTITGNGQLVLSLENIPVPTPAPNEVLVRIDAAPINPSDLALLLGPADTSNILVGGTADSPTATLPVPEAFLKSLSKRLDIPMPVGNEAAGVVVATGEQTTHLLGKTVGIAGGDMFCQYRCVAEHNCLIMNEGTTAKEAASCFVNPLTSLSMVETMRLEKHTALVHTAAASNLGQMLVKICQQDKVPLVNIVRSEQQVQLLQELGAQYICNSSAPTFMEDLVAALIETGATLAFDAIGGGKLASQILTAMEIAITRDSPEYSRYGSSIHKQVYVYGGLDMAPIVLNRAFGMAWGVGGWLLTPFIYRMGQERFKQLRQRVANEIHTTFASHYTKEITLAEALQPDIIQDYNRKATGEKFLIIPNG